MSAKDAFFTAPDLGDDEVILIRKENTVDISKDENRIDDVSDFFISTELDGSPKGINRSGKQKLIRCGVPVVDSPREFTDDLRKEWSTKLLDNGASATVKSVVTDSFKERVIVRFVARNKNISCDIEIPLDITANDLIIGLNDAYNLEIDLSDIRQCYLSCENPVALLKGKRLLGEYGIRDGSLITYYR